jgi:2-haloacid dehalogenase
MPHDLGVIAFDVIETMFSLRPVEQRLQAAGLAADVLRPLFAGMLRDAFALDAAGTPRTFPEVARASIEVTMVKYGIEPDATAIVGIMKAFTELPAHDDARMQEE